MGNVFEIIIFGVITVVIIIVLRLFQKKKIIHKKELNQQFPHVWRDTLRKKVMFYNKLNEADKTLFEKRIQLFLATKNVEGVDTDIDDTIRLMVASSAVIPTFAFPEYNYPSVTSILIYPNSFDEHFQTQRFKGHEEFILGMVGNRSMSGTMILSKPDLVAAFDGLVHKTNVGIHEFVHLLDKEDGDIDGIPESLLDKRFVAPWLHEIKKEMNKIEKGNSDINPYGLTNNAEFLAVVSEYFFDNPEKFKKRHPELYQFLSKIFNPDKSSELLK